jgi:hypothetical protein
MVATGKHLTGTVLLVSWLAFGKKPSAVCRYRRMLQSRTGHRVAAIALDRIEDEAVTSASGGLGRVGPRSVHLTLPDEAGRRQ